MVHCFAPKCDQHSKGHALQFFRSAKEKKLDEHRRWICLLRQGSAFKTPIPDHDTYLMRKVVMQTVAIFVMKLSLSLYSVRSSHSKNIIISYQLPILVLWLLISFVLIKYYF